MDFVVYNPNPIGAKAGDCVIRAIMKATGMEWHDVYVEVCAMGYAMCEWGNANRIWSRWLIDHGYKRHGLPDTGPVCYSIADFARDHKHGTFIVGTGTHVVCIVDGVIYDSWDSSAEIAVFYYDKPEQEE